MRGVILRLVLLFLAWRPKMASTLSLTVSGTHIQHNQHTHVGNTFRPSPGRDSSVKWTFTIFLSFEKRLWAVLRTFCVGRYHFPSPACRSIFPVSTVLSVLPNKLSSSICTAILLYNYIQFLDRTLVRRLVWCFFTLRLTPSEFE